ncbi:hypothetical protein COCON_G00095240 [Conger conger]|uniref:Small kinetochore-associated protein n=1 Tax=Conger conger TaxID=82655 RepID=A0A9Q1DLW7_CONCO|nr:small kinetochore-associated protein [Conger conger]KAJ8274899.1 hypothetical protein COCON_G00095240 [Conger conger]
MKRTKFELKEATAPSHFNVGLKPPNNAHRKKLTALASKGPSSRLEAELSDQKRLLEAFNGDLQKNLLQSKEKIDLLEQQYEDLKGEKNEIQKQLENCLHLLVAGNIDLDLGEKIAETTQQKEEQRKEVQSVSQELMGELQTFGQKLSEHRAQVQQVQERMKDLREKREQHVEEREAFSLEVDEMEKALEQAEQLLVGM